MDKINYIVLIPNRNYSLSWSLRDTVQVSGSSSPQLCPAQPQAPTSWGLTYGLMSQPSLSLSPSPGRYLIVWAGGCPWLPWPAMLPGWQWWGPQLLAPCPLGCRWSSLSPNTHISDPLWRVSEYTPAFTNVLGSLVTN